ncbi:MAG: hypothetical protein JWL77_3921 [Chthonomonadaceae bacterium]|nr:hypothetical protein [Chthonomonadaceae bacterium]
MQEKAVKPTSVWAMNGRDRQWHYMVQAIATEPFCHATVVLDTMRLFEDKRPDGMLWCQECETEFARRNKAYTRAFKPITPANVDNTQRQTEDRNNARVLDSRSQKQSLNVPTKAPKCSKANSSAKTAKTSGKVQRPTPQDDYGSLVAAIKSLAKLRALSRTALEEKRTGKRSCVGGIVLTSPSTVEQWSTVCTRFITLHPAESGCWRAVRTRCNDRTTPCGPADLAFQVTESLAVFKLYKTEEQSELVEAARMLSDLLTAFGGMPYEQAYRQLPSYAREAIARSVQRKEPFNSYLSLSAQQALLAEHAAKKKNSKELPRDGESAAKKEIPKEPSRPGAKKKPTHQPRKKYRPTNASSKFEPESGRDPSRWEDKKNPTYRRR